MALAARLHAFTWRLAPVLWLACPVVAAEGHGDLPHAFEAGWQGEKTCELLFEDDTVRVGTCVFPPGIGHERHYHNPHFGYTLQGSTLRITDANGTVERTLETGETWSTDSVTIHEALNIGDHTTSYLIVEPKPDAE